MNDTDHQLLAIRVADAFRTHLGLSDWKWVDEFEPDNSHPTHGHRYLFHAKESGDLARHGIYALTLAIALPRTVFADIRLNGGGVSLIVHPDRVSLKVDMEPFGGLVYKTMSESEIDEMKQEWEPFRLAMEAVEEADKQLKAEAESQEEEEE